MADDEIDVDDVEEEDEEEGDLPEGMSVEEPLDE